MNINETKKIICEDCGIEREEQHFYLSRIEGQKRMKICKDCLVNEIMENGLNETLKKYNIPMISKEIEACNKKTFIASEFVPLYMQKINSLLQYKNLTWKDSTFYEEEDKGQESDFYDEIIVNLKKEAKKLNFKLEHIREDNRDMNLYIATLKSLRETLDLISKHDWQLKYSEYYVGVDTDDGKSFNGKQIAIWEQNNRGQIRNHQVWDIVNDDKIDRVELFTFKKGDKIPQFVEEYPEEYYKGTFGRDVLIIKKIDHVDVYPMESVDDGYSTINFNFTEKYNNEIKHDLIVIKGAPTTIFNKPFGSPENRSILTNY